MDASELRKALSEPFEEDQVKFKPQTIKGNRAMAIAYIDARLVEDRLDKVVGVENWQDDYEVLDGGSVLCRLRVRMGGEWIVKSDVGSESEQPDGGDRTKAAFSDALKRAAVKFGIGRYLYRLPQQWLDYDPQKKQFTQRPRLYQVAQSPQQKRQPAPSQPQKSKEEPKPAPLGAELDRRLAAYDAKLAEQGMIQAGELVEHVLREGIKAGFGSDFATWTEPVMGELAVAQTKKFQEAIKQRSEAS